MVHWLTAVRRIARGQNPSNARLVRRALVIGDAAGKSVRALQDQGYHVVWALPPYGTTAGYVNEDVSAPRVRLGADWLPFADGTFDGVVLHETLEFMIDDRRGVEEAFRVLRPGGWFVTRVPTEGRLAWVDAFNIYRYFNETLTRGSILPEAIPTGWRRHYGPRDIEAIVARVSVENLAEYRSGGWLTDAVYAGALLTTRLIAKNPNHTRAVRRIYARTGDLEEHLPLGRYRILVGQKSV